MRQRLVLVSALASTALAACRSVQREAPGRVPPCAESRASDDFRKLSRPAQARVAAAATRGKFDVIGWGDEQRLAVPTFLGGLKHGPLGRIIPIDTLERIREESYARGWVLVARIQMKGNYKKLQLGATSYDSRGNDTSTNTLWLCRHPSDTLWFARIIRPDQRTVHFTVTRERHPNVRVPGAARWVWRDDDEAAWVMCDVGCCTTNSLMS